MTASRGTLQATSATAQDPVRRALDVIIAGAALMVLAVPMLLIAALIRLGSPGSALFRQSRLGFEGRPFTMYKFRTMRTGGNDKALRRAIARELAGEETSSNGSFKLDNDSRITGLGAALRRTSLDELPQLFNVLNGSMTLVGPRPCLDWEAEMFPPGSEERFAVVPGLTGLWQVSGRSTIGTLEMLELDRHYVQTRSLGGDLRILALTVPSLLRGDGAR
jgi:lipopolysaccharide/colanic/teichoic acid biosynthesis glycosyltransferase